MVMTLKERVHELIKRALPGHASFQVFVPENDAFGHFSTNAAFQFAKAQGMDPLAAAENLAAHISEIAPEGFFEKIEVRHPGFINFFLGISVLHGELFSILKKKDAYGRHPKKKEKIQIEFVSANPTGPLTLGNGRGGFLGDALARVLDRAGYRVTREYYINDVGRQIQILGASILRGTDIGETRLLELVPELMHIDREELYRGDYIEDLAEEFYSRYSGKKLERFLKKGGVAAVGAWGANRLLKDIQKVIKSFGIRFDEWFRESSLYKKQKGESPADKVYRFLEENGSLGEKEGAIWFLVSRFESDRDRVVRRSKKEGQATSYDTYFFSDIVYHWNKFKARKFDKVINIWGADHHGHIKSVRAAVRAIGVDPKRIEFLIVQLVRLVRGGEEVRMSKRKGEYVTLKELVDEVGLDAARFFFLMNAADSHMTFDLALAKERSLKNPVYYAQYAAVRAQSILKKIPARLKARALSSAKKGGFATLRSEADRNLIRILGLFPELIGEVAADYGVQRLTRYAGDLAGAFNAFYEKERIIGEEEQAAAERVLLVMASLVVFKNLFSVLGISLPKKM